MMKYYYLTCKNCAKLLPDCTCTNPEIDFSNNYYVTTETAASTKKYPTGWVCPKCGAGIAPWVDRCPCTTTYKVTWSGV